MPYFAYMNFDSKSTDRHRRKLPFLRLTPLLLCALIGTGILTACSRLTEDNLQKIHNGMSTSDVKAILGEPTNAQTGSALGIVSGTTYVYHTDTSDVKITFVDDKVIATEGEFK
jgi:hypothetical protein